MVQTVGPCITGWSPAEIITAVGGIVTVCLTIFLARRRVLKDAADDERWTTLTPGAEVARKGRIKNGTGGNSNDGP